MSSYTIRGRKLIFISKFSVYITPCHTRYKRKPNIHSANTVTDSEADSELEEEDERTAGSEGGGGGGFMDNIMSIDQLEPAGSAEESVKPNSVIQVKRLDTYFLFLFSF